MSPRKNDEEHDAHWKEQQDRMEEEDARSLYVGAIFALMFLILVALVFLLMRSVAVAHDALPTAAMPNGWSYPMKCCSGYDCRQINNTPEEILNQNLSGEKILDKQGGYLYDASNEFIPWNDKRIQPSPDGRMHICTRGGKKGTQILCLFVPDKGY